MKLGFWGCLNQSGVGYVGKNIINGLGIQHIALIPNRDKGFRLDWVKGRDWTLLSVPVFPRAVITDWLDKTRPELVLVVETPYTPYLGEECKKRGIKTVNVAMWEGADNRLLKDFDYHVAKFDWEKEHLEKVMGYKTLDLTLPTEIHKFKFKKRTGKPRVWLHVAGYGGFWGRKNTELTMRAFAQSKAFGTLIVRAQLDDCAYSQMFHSKSRKLTDIAEELGDDRIVLEIGNKTGENYELYDDSIDVSIQPSRIEGYGLNIIEPMMMGIPAITTDAEPMSCWGFKPYLVKTDFVTIGKKRFDKDRGEFTHQGVRFADLKEKDLTDTINLIADRDIGDDSEKARTRMEAMGWDKQRDKWIDALEGVIHGG